MASGRMAPSNAKSRHNIHSKLRLDSRLAFRRQVRQTHGMRGTQGIIFADVAGPIVFSLDRNNPVTPPDPALPDPSAPSLPSTTPVPCTDAQTPPALEVATLRLLLAVALPHHRGAPTAEGPTLRLTGIVSPIRHRPLLGVWPLPKRLFSRPCW